MLVAEEAVEIRVLRRQGKSIREALGVNCEVLFFLVGRLPDDTPVIDASDDQPIEAFRAFREHLRTETGEGSTVSLSAVSGAANGRISHH